MAVSYSKVIEHIINTYSTFGRNTAVSGKETALYETDN